MIFLIHGDDFSKTRKVITELQKKLESTNKTDVNVNNITPGQLTEISSSYDLFSEPPFVSVDVSDAGRKNLLEYVDALKSVPTDVNIVIYSNKELSKSNVFIKNKAALKAKEVINNAEPSSDIFRFLDYLFSNNRKNTYNELQRLMQDQTDPFYLFSMIVYGFRNIAYIVTNSPLSSKIAPFAKNKALKQAKSYTEQKVSQIYKTLYQIDKSMKTGKIHPSISSVYTVEQILKEK